MVRGGECLSVNPNILRAKSAYLFGPLQSKKLTFQAVCFPDTYAVFARRMLGFTCYSIEMQRALERHASGNARVIPIILRPVDWQKSPIGKLQVLPMGARPVTGRGWKNLDEAFTNVAQGIQSIIEELQTSSEEIESRMEEPHLASSLIQHPLMPTVAKPSIPPVQPSPLKVLIIDDEENSVNLVRLGLKYEGFQVEWASDGEEGLIAARRIAPDLILLDLAMPVMEGFEVIRRLRTSPVTRHIPILVVTGHIDEKYRIKGFDLGVDDYILKPFAFEELLTRMKAVLRRQGLIAKKEDDLVLKSGDLELNTRTHEVTRSGHPIELTVTEYNLLLLFLSYPGQVLDRQTILNLVWGYDFLGETSIIEVYIRYLREKIEDSPDNPRLLQTVRGIGYVLK